MILAFEAVPPAERRLLGGGRLEGPMPWVIAIQMFVMVVIAAAGLALAQGARFAAAGVENRYSVQLADGAARAPATLAALRSAPGVAAVRPVAEQELRATLERWLGPEGAAADLPLPVLIDVDLAPGASPAPAQAALAREVPGARLIAYDSALAPVTRALRALGWLALALVSLTAAAAAAAVVLATRGALDTHRSTIEVMHGVGATDEQIARLFQRRMALDSLVGGTIGGVIAGIILLLVAGGASDWLADLAGGPLLGAGAILLLAALPLAGTLLAALVARWAVLRGLARLM